MTPYGYERAGNHYLLDWSTDRCDGRIWRAVRRRALSTLGFDVAHVWRNRAVMDGADAIWTHTEREHLAVTAAYAVRPWRRPPALLAQTVWLWDEWPLKGPMSRWVVAFLLRRQPVEVVHSRVNRDIAAREVPGRRVIQIPFGTATSTSITNTGSEGTGSPPTILSVGNDRHRDWALLRDVASTLPEVRFRVMSASARAHGLHWPANVEVAPAASRQELEEAYRSCTALVLPLLANVHASAATTLIEGMSSACRVVVTDVGGIADYAAPEVVLVPPADAPALRRAVWAAVEGRVEHVDPAAVRRLGLAQEDYVARYVLVTQWLLGRGDLDPDVSDFSGRHSAFTLSEGAVAEVGEPPDQSRSW